MKKWVVSTIAVVSVLVVGVAGYGLYIYNSVKATANEIYEKREPSVVPVTVSSDGKTGAQADTSKSTENPPAVHLNEREPFTVLVMGVDQREDDPGRSDSMILLTVNPAKQSILMFNIPRDTRTEIVGHGTTDKINHAYAFGGVNMSVATVEHFLGYPVNYYIKVNMEGFAKIIDLLGGVEVNNPFAFQYEGYDFKQGDLKLDGSEALAFSRMRYDDPRGDLGRNARQREILEQVINNALKISNVVKVESLLNQVGDSVRTDITFDNMKTFVTDYRSDLKTIEQVEIKGQGKKINGIWYYMVSDEERQRIHNVIKEHLQ
ncbi:LCP family glycopolymer transferase [Paenibacillus sp. S28]|uniref:LCP family glycopolymer transferase n=1 Tax=Paenibacillus sp. S28 TaxID=2767463 RepID=UPI00190E55E7|nr:LCP family protein [Paenibacillus sp. S28]MBJ9991484.1 LCP family protein [Paenibacillus sp. S28]